MEVSVLFPADTLGDFDGARFQVYAEESSNISMEKTPARPGIDYRFKPFSARAFSTGKEICTASMGQYK